MTALADNGGNSYPVGTVAELAGVSPRTVRYYEEIGLLTAARRSSGGRRVFDDDALSRLRFIGRLKTLGFSLNEIRHINAVFAVNQSTAEMLTALDERMERHLATLGQRLGELKGLRTDLLAYRRRLRARRAELERGARPGARRAKSKPAPGAGNGRQRRRG